MSCDFGVWCPQKRIGNKDAGELYARLCDGDTSGVVPHPAVDAFYAELTARHPEIDTVPEEKSGDYDYCPWSCKLDHSSGHVIMSCVWSKATYVDGVVRQLALKHRLAVYDPQSDKVIYPDGAAGRPEKTSRGSLWVLGCLALLFAGVLVYSERLAASRAPVAIYVLAGLCGLLAGACFRQAWR